MRAMLATALLAASTQIAAAQSVGGHYTVQGAGAGGGIMYAGVAQIGFRGEECIITWHTGGAPVHGICMVQGRVFSVGYILQGQAGVAVYEIQADGSLRGRWSVGNGVGTESLYPR
jgi:hypothetical protein